MTSYQVALAPHASVLLSVVPQIPPTSRLRSGPGRARPGSRTPLAATKAWATSPVSIPREQCCRGHLGAERRQSPLAFHVANATGSPSTLTARTLGPATGHVNGTAMLQVPSTPAWTSWRTVPVRLTMTAGTNLLVCSVESADQGGVNLDYVALA